MCNITDEPLPKKAKTGMAATIARSNILALHPYRCARDDYDSGILLDANENAIGPTSLPTNSLPDNNHLLLERYPCPYQSPLKEAYTAYRGGNLKAENVFVGVGSDEAIDLLMRIFCKPGEDQIMTTPPTYGMYNVSANINDVQIVQVPLTKDFDLRIPEVSAFGDDTCMHYVYCAVLHAHCMQIAGGTSTRHRTPLVI
jgi:histidinol-phosphate aminotransferase